MPAEIVKATFAECDEMKPHDLISVRAAQFEGNRKAVQMHAKKGFKWSTCMKDKVKTELCEQDHFGYCVEGHIKVWMGKEGKEFDIKAGDAYYIPPYHDAEVMEECRGYEFSAPKIQKATFANLEEKKPHHLISVRAAEFEGGRKAVKMHAQVGFKWSTCMKEMVKTELCEAEHFGYCESGRIKVWMGKDGKEFEVKAGEVYYIPPHHDAEVMEECHGYEFSHAKPKGWVAQATQS